MAARDCHGGTPLLHSRTKKRTGEPPPAPALFESDVEKRWAAAYRSALGHGMPGNWYAAIRAELASPEPDLGLLQAVTAKTVREAHALARQRKRPFGPGWVLNLLRERAVELHERQRRQQAERAARAAQQRAAAQAKERAADEEACWAALPPERQEQCRQAARGHFPRFQPAESVLEALARQLAHQAAEDAEHEA